MSRAGLPDLLLEWSPTAVSSYDPGGKHSSSAPQIEQLTVSGGKAVLLALSRRSTFVKAVRVPDAAKDDIIQLLRVSSGSHLPLPSNEVAYDIHVTSDKDLEGRLISLLATRASDLKEVLARVKAQGYKVGRVVPVAWGSVLIAEKLGLQDAVVVQKTEEGWGIDLVHAGGLRYSRLAPLTSTDLEDEIARTCAAAEVPVPDIIAAADAPLPTANHRTTVTCLQALADHPERLDINLELQEEVIARNQHERALKNRNAIAVAAAALALAGGIYFDSRSRQHDLSILEPQWVATHRAELATQKDLGDKITKVDAAQKALDQALKPGQPLTEALLAAANLAPQGLWLTGMTGERGKTLTLRGAAMQAAQVSSYVKSLAALQGKTPDGTNANRFRNVQLVFANQALINQQSITQFSISLVAVGNVPVADNTPTGGVKK